MAVPTGTHTATVSLGYVNSGDGQQIYYLASYYSSSCYSFYKGPARWIALSQYPGGSFVVPEAGAMFKSLDNGATWTLTGGLSPDVSSGGAFTSPAYDLAFAAFDDVGVDPNAATKITAMGNSSTGALAHYAGFFTDFNFGSESWGAGYGAVDYPTLGTHALPMPSSTPGGSVAHAVMEGSGGTPPYIAAGAAVVGSSPWLIIDAAGNAHLGDDPGGRFHIGTLSEYGNVRIRSGSLMFAFPNTVSGHMEVLSRPVGSSTWAVDTVSSIDGLYRTNQPPWMSSATDLFFMGTNQRSIYLVQKAGGVWGAPVLLWAPTTDTNPDLAGATGGRIWQLIASCNPVLGGLDITFEYDGLVIAPGDVMLTFHVPPTGAGWSTLVGGCSDVSSIGIDCNAPPGGALGNPYSHSLTITGAPAGSTVAITGGALPPGLTIDDTGRISGTPTLGGNYTYTATVTPPGLLRSPRSGSSVTLPSSPEGHDLGGSPFATPGIEYGGKQYLFVHQGAEFLVGDAKIHILRSSDNGLTWTDLTSIAVTPTGITPVPNVGYTVCQDGSLAYILYTDMSGISNSLTTPASFASGPLYLRVFNLATESLGAESTTGFTVYKVSAGFRSFTNLVRRGPGDMLFVHSSIPELISSNFRYRISVATFNGSSFGSPMLVPGQGGTNETYWNCCAGVDDTGILHIINSANGAKQHLHTGFSGSSFGPTSVVTTPTTYGYTNSTSRLVSYSGSIAFAASGTEFAFDKTVYHASSGVLNPTWDVHNIDTFTPVIDNGSIFSSLPLALAYQDGKLHLFWTRSGSVPDDWDTRVGLGVVQHSQAAVTDLATWTPEDTIIANPGPPENKWAAAQVDVYVGPVVGLGIFAGFTGVSVPADDPIENAQFLRIPPGGGTVGPASVTCTTTVGYGTLTTSCGAPPVYTQGVVGTPYRPSVMLGVLGSLPPVYDLNGTFLWDFPVIPPPGFHWQDDPAQPDYGYLIGTPALAGVQNFTYSVFTPDGQSVTNTCPLTVNPGSGGGGGGGGGGGPLHIFCNNPPGGKVGVPYSHTFPVVGATGPTTYSVVMGALPPGVTLDPATGDLTGTPTAPGTYSFSVKVQQ